MNETNIKEEKVAAARTELLRVAGLVSVPQGQNEATFRQSLSAFVNSLPPDSALKLADAYTKVATMALADGRGLASAGLKPADMILGAVFGAAQKGKAEVSAGDALGAALPTQPGNLQRDEVPV